MIPLPPSRYSSALKLLQPVPFNTNFAEAVLRRHIRGTVYSDRLEDPGVILVSHPCGMSLLAGEGASVAFEAALRRYLANEGNLRQHLELLQVFPATWEERIARMMAGRILDGRDVPPVAADATAKAAVAGKIVQWVRLNYAFNAANFAARRRPLLPAGLRVASVGPAGFAFEGTVTPGEFWDSVDDFATRGIAYAVLEGDRIVSLAFSAFALEGRLEIGIETCSTHRGLGLAMHACAAFIDHCLERNIEPVWSCRQANLGSERTARALGFEETRRIAYYKLVE